MSKLTTDEIKQFVGKHHLVFLEIGCNVGRDTQRFLKAFDNLEIYCFEPDPRCIRKFKKNVQDPRCSLVEAGVWNKNGEAKMHLSGGSKPGHRSQHINSSSLLRPKGHLDKHPWCKFSEKCTIKTVSLDSWEDGRFSSIDLIWADTQGAEEQMIAGGSRTLAKTKYFYTEYSDEELYTGQIKLNRILEMLPNFVIQAKYGTDILLRNRSYE